MFVRACVAQMSAIINSWSCRKVVDKRWNSAETFITACREIASNCSVWPAAAAPPTHGGHYDVLVPDTKFGASLLHASTLKDFNAPVGSGLFRLGHTDMFKIPERTKIAHFWMQLTLGIFLGLNLFCDRAEVFRSVFWKRSCPPGWKKRGGRWHCG